MKEKIYYKVVSEDPDTKQLSSALITGKFKVDYFLDVWVGAPEELKEKGYHICVFEDLVAVDLFLDINKDILTNPKVYECVCKDEIFSLPGKLNVNHLRVGKFIPAVFDSYPVGTFMFKEIKLIKEVK